MHWCCCRRCYKHSIVNNSSLWEIHKGIGRDTEVRDCQGGNEPLLFDGAIRKLEIRYIPGIYTLVYFVNIFFSLPAPL